MSGKGNGHQPSRDSERVPIRAEVDLEFESFQGFLSEYSANISLGGMFVRATDPPPVGTVLRFSLKLKGDFKLIQGRGEVAWNRREGSSAEEPAGAGIRFLELEPASADLIRRMVDRYKVQGGQPFSLEGEPVDSTSAEASILEAPPGQAFRDDIFIPPDVPPLTAPLPGPSTPEPAPVREASAVRRPPSAAPPARRARSQVRPGTILLLLAAAVVGGLVSHFGERLVHWATGYDKVLADRVVYDIPPPASLASQPAEPATVVEPPAEESKILSPEEAGVVDLGPGPVPDLQGEEEGSPAVGFAEDYGAADEALNRIRLITWKETPDGSGTVVTLWGNGNLRRENVLRVRLGSQTARELVKLKGIDWPFRDAVLDVDSSLVRRIRTGFHPKETINELHVVFDLKDAEAQLSRIELGERSVQLFFSR